MDFKEPHPKKYCNLQLSAPLPIINISETIIYKYSGYFNGFSIVFKEQEEMKKLNSMGFFGKANLSRGHPVFNQEENDAQIIRKRIFNQRKEWATKYAGKKAPIKKVIVVPDSEDENEDYFTNLKPEYQVDSSCLREVLNLSLEEAFFLFNSVECLNIYNANELLTKQSAWKLFSETDKYFIQNYAVYYYFRSKNWVVKSGIKFGGDFLLYKDGPPFYHASFVVIIDVLNCITLERKTDMCRRSMEIKHLLGLNRLCQTVGKELLICQLMLPDDLIIKDPEDILRLSINETIMSRWVPSQNREISENNIK